MMDWFRSYHGAPTDPKWILIARRAGTQPGVVAAVWWALMDHASQATPRGTAEGFDVETVAASFGWDEETVAAVIDALRGKGLIGEHGMLAAWDRRQPQDGTSAARARAWRDSKRAESASANGSERSRTETNAGERDRAGASDREEERREEENNTPPAPPAGGVSEPDGDAGEDPKPKGGRGRREDSDSDPVFNAAWDLRIPRPNDSRRAALKAWRARLREGVAPAAMLEGFRRYVAWCEAGKVEPRFVKQTATFFGPDRWWESDFTAEGDDGDGHGSGAPRAGTPSGYDPDGAAAAQRAQAEREAAYEAALARWTDDTRAAWAAAAPQVRKRLHAAAEARHEMIRGDPKRFERAVQWTRLEMLGAEIGNPKPEERRVA